MGRNRSKYSKISSNVAGRETLLHLTDPTATTEQVTFLEHRATKANIILLFSLNFFIFGKSSHKWSVLKAKQNLVNARRNYFDDATRTITF